MKKLILALIIVSTAKFSLAQSDVINIIPSGNVGVGTGSGTPVSYLDVSGSYGQKVTTITANITLDATHNTVVCNNGSTAIIVTLPAASGASGRVYIIKRNSASTNTVTIAGGATIDGVGSFILTSANQAIEVFSDGAEWKTTVGGLSGLSALTAGNDIDFGTSSTNSIDIEPVLNFVHTVSAPASNNLNLNAASGFAAAVNLNNGTTGTMQTFRIGNGAGGPDVFYVHADGKAYTTNWWRSIGNTGWFSETHGGGIWMDQGTYVRVYGGVNTGLTVPGNVGIGTTVPGVSLDIRTTDAVKMPSGTTAQRPASPLAGTTRFNTDIAALEYFDGTQWVSANTTQVPIATIAPYAGATAPSGWLICDGTAVSRTTFNLLFAIVGTTYGAGDGSTTFNLPDLRGRAAFGLSGSAPYNTLGAIGGAISATPSLSTSLTAAYPTFTATLPSHTHTLPAHFHDIGTGASLATTATTTGVPSVNATSAAGAHTHTYSGTTSSAGAHSHTFTRGQGDQNWSNGGGSSWWGARNITETTTSSGDHTHTFSGTTASSGSHTHDLGNHTHSVPSASVTGTVGLVTGGVDGNIAMTSGTGTNPSITITAGGSTTAVSGTVTGTVSTANPFQVTNYIIKATNTATASIVAVNIPSGTLGQTLYNNGSVWTPTSLSLIHI